MVGEVQAIYQTTELSHSRGRAVCLLDMLHMGCSWISVIVATGTRYAEQPMSTAPQTEPRENGLCIQTKLGGKGGSFMRGNTDGRLLSACPQVTWYSSDDSPCTASEKGSTHMATLLGQMGTPPTNWARPDHVCKQGMGAGLGLLVEHDQQMKR